MEHQPQTKNCQNCKNDFIIEPDDFSFYEKIKVPAPTFCSQCRFVRRFITKNERSLYKRKCSMCEKSIIAVYDENAIFPVYCPECYQSDKWEASEYGQDYDFFKPFFQQWKELFSKVPRQSLFQNGNCINSEYANFVYNAKNVYLGISILTGSEDVYFSNNIDNSKQIIDSYNVLNSELIYESIGSTKNYNCQYSYWSTNCINCNLILDCNNCQDCFGCVALQNKRYCIWNFQYTKEEYDEKIKEYNPGSYSTISENIKKFNDFALRFPRQYAKIVGCTDCVGDELRNCNNTKYSFNCYNTENIKYAYRCPSAKDSMDVTHSYAELSYEHAFGGSVSSQNIKFIETGVGNMSDSEYIDYCKNSSSLFGCIGLKNKKYFILNKQYTKEEYEEMIPKIKQHMNEMPYIDLLGRLYKYGEFFPFELSPFGYNESAISDHFPLTKDEILKMGYPYKEKPDNKYIVTLKSEDIPDNINDINESILNEVIECKHSGRAFKITPYEFQFYKRMNAPIPRLHPDERHKNRLALKNPMVLYTRSCMHEGCLNTFETTYAPNRPEIVYCKDCYQQEVY